MKICNISVVLAGMACHAVAADVHISGKLDLSQAGTAKTIIASVAGTDILDTVDRSTGQYLLRGASTSIKAKTFAKLGLPKLAWKELGKTVRLAGNTDGYVVDVYSFDGKTLATGIKFVSGVATVGTGNSVVYTRLRKVGMSGTYAAKSMAADSSVGSVVFIVTTCDSTCRTDTLTEVPIIKWDTVLNTKYIVQRNVKVTLPTKYAAADTVKCGWFNLGLNPQNYFTISLGNYKSRKWSGYIYSAYDSASYGADSYLYSAVVICKKKDSVIAFSDSVARVTAARTGDIEFDSTELVNKIVSKPLADTAIVPWYAFAVNKSSVNVINNKIMRLDSNVSFSDTLIDSSWLAKRPYTFSNIGLSIRLDGEYVYGYNLQGTDTAVFMQHVKIYDDSTITSKADSVRITFTADTTDTAGYVSADTIGLRIDEWGNRRGTEVLSRGYTQKLATTSGTRYTVSLPIYTNGIIGHDVAGTIRFRLYVRLPVSFNRTAKFTTVLVYKHVNKHYK